MITERSWVQSSAWFDGGSGPQLVVGGAFASMGSARALNVAQYLGGDHWAPLGGGIPAPVIDLEAVDAGQATQIFPDADYLITLDADSLLLPGYAMCLIGIMEQPGNERIAVAQTPYSAIPNAKTQLERIAGATTDVQYLIHQGFTHHKATFWVGANAVLRHKALLEIAEDDVERGYPIRRFIQFGSSLVTRTLPYLTPSQPREASSRKSPGSCHPSCPGRRILRRPPQPSQKKPSAFSTATSRSSWQQKPQVYLIL